MSLREIYMLSLSQYQNQFILQASLCEGIDNEPTSWTSCLGCAQPMPAAAAVPSVPPPNVCLRKDREEFMQSRFYFIGSVTSLWACLSAELGWSVGWSVGRLQFLKRARSFTFMLLSEYLFTHYSVMYYIFKLSMTKCVLSAQQELLGFGLDLYTVR